MLRSPSPSSSSSSVSSWHETPSPEYDFSAEPGAETGPKRSHETAFPTSRAPTATSDSTAPKTRKERSKPFDAPADLFRNYDPERSPDDTFTDGKRREYKGHLAAVGCVLEVLRAHDLPASEVQWLTNLHHEAAADLQRGRTPDMSVALQELPHLHAHLLPLLRQAGISLQEASAPVQDAIRQLLEREREEIVRGLSLPDQQLYTFFHLMEGPENLHTYRRFLNKDGRRPGARSGLAVRASRLLCAGLLTEVPRPRGRTHGGYYQETQLAMSYAPVDIRPEFGIAMRDIFPYDLLAALYRKSPDDWVLAQDLPFGTLNAGQRTRLVTYLASKGLLDRHERRYRLSGACRALLQNDPPTDAKRAALQLEHERSTSTSA